MTEQREQTGISRRTIAKGAAWAVPALPLVAATPAYAKSGSGPTARFCNACKQPGNSCPNYSKGFSFTLRFTNPTNQLVYIYPTILAAPNAMLNPRFTVTSTTSNQAINFSYQSARRFTVVNGVPVVGTPLLESEPLAANGGTLDIFIDAGSTANSGNFEARGFLYMAWGHTAPRGSDTDHPYTPLPPTPPATTPLPGEGWISTPFVFLSFPPCDNVTCLPTTNC